ncbi:MAG TPA: hypothetical protein VGC67_12970 [Cellulomonas sp.]
MLSGAEVLLLDEAASNLDSTNESLLLQAVTRASERCTVVVIAHRLSTVVDADQIVVLEGGQVTASGTHGELLATSPGTRSWSGFSGSRSARPDGRS